MKFINLIAFSIIFCSSVFSQNNIDFTAETLENKELKLSEVYSESPTLVSFWALWCKPCRAEMKQLENLYNIYKDKGFTIIGVNQDSPRSLAKGKIICFITLTMLLFQLCWTQIKKFFKNLTVNQFPFCFIQ
ncbi:MAG: TlpA family protein disulfide reductase [Ignavibacteriales bacterium]|nr:TlpA family protein disulfide reductase [Ignavibacteriales bacterium]